MAAISNRMPGVTIAYTVNGTTKTKRFSCAHKGKRFYTRQHAAGNNPRIVGDSTMAKKTTTTKTAPKKTTAAKKAAPKKAAPAAKADGLTDVQTRVLTALKNTASGKGLTRAQLSEKTGINKGWSRILGAYTKDDGGANADNSMTGLGLVSSQKMEGEPVSYYITAKGKKALK